MAFDSACFNRLLSLKIVDNTLSVLALIRLVTLTFNLFTRTCGAFIAREVVNILTNFGVLGLFVLDLWANTCQMDYDLPTLTFYIGGHGTCR